MIGPLSRIPTAAVCGLLTATLAGPPNPAAAQDQPDRPNVPGAEAAPAAAEDPAAPTPPGASPNASNASDAPAAPAAAPGAEPDEIDRLIAGLSSDAYEQRERSTRRLMRIGEAHADRLVGALEKTTRHEAAHRLRRVLRHVAIREMWRVIPKQDASSLGLRYEPAPAYTVPQQERMGVRVVLTLPGFPAHESLRAGDVVTGVNGAPLAGSSVSEAFAQRISEHLPTDPIELTVVRDGAIRRLTLDPAPRRALGQLLSRQRPLTLSSGYINRLAEREAELRSTGPQPEFLRAPTERETIEP